MGSIEEFERENDGSSSPPHELVFSGVLTPKPPPRTSNPSPNSKHPKTGQRLPTSDDHLPPLSQSCEAQKSIFFSPWPSRNTPKPSAPSALGILLTPILANKSANDLEKFKNIRLWCAQISRQLLSEKMQSAKQYPQPHTSGAHTGPFAQIQNREEARSVSLQG